MNKDAFYFPHFSNARQDRKLRRLRKQLGIEGYGIYFMILEVLREQPEFSYPVDDIDLLADEFNTSEQKVQVVVKNYGLFEIDHNNMFFSYRFNEYLQPYLEKKERRKIGGIKGNLIKYNYIKKEDADKLSDAEILALNDIIKNKVATESLPSRSGSQSKVKKSKVKKSKVKESIYSFFEFWDDYDKKVGKAKCELKFNKLNESERGQIKDFLRIYINATPDIQYRMNPETFLNKQTWQDDWEYWKQKANNLQIKTHNYGHNKSAKQFTEVNLESIQESLNELQRANEEIQDY